MKIDMKLAQQLLDYLVRQPYKDVNMLIAGLATAAQQSKDTDKENE